MRTTPATTVLLLGIVVICSCKPKDESTAIEEAAETVGDEGLIAPEVDLPDDELEALPIAMPGRSHQRHIEKSGIEKPRQ
jgi:hypothetical protein